LYFLPPPSVSGDAALLAGGEDNDDMPLIDRMMLAGS
jgi:hypothetical protein